MMANYRTPPVALARGEGATVWDVDGREYTDLLGGIATTILGHAHPKVVEAISAQAAKLGHVSNLAMHEPGLALAERLLELAGRPGRGFFGNSGAEANEAAFKISRLTRRPEVQTGMGRTGHWFAHQADGLQPDVITLAKALGGGLPMGATLAFGEAADLMTAGSHGSTFGGNPIAAAAALAVIDTIRDEGLLERAKELEHRFTAGIEGLGHAGVSQVRGRGALLGVVLTAPVAGELEAQLRAAGFLANAD